MKIKNKITTLLAAALLTACTDYNVAPTYTVGEADNTIVLRAGISEGGEGVQTRAVSSESHHSTHKTFKENTQLTLKVDGDWWKTADANSPTKISRTTKGTIKDVVTVNSDSEPTHNVVDFTPAEKINWDDYGTADPNNMGLDKGRKKGLTIYGAAVNGEAIAPDINGTTGKEWTALTWSVGTVANGIVDQSGAKGWTDKDLLTSNNVQPERDDVQYATDGTFKFDYRDEGKLLEFTHAMSKVTVNLTADEGFPGYSTGAGNAKFEEAPKVTLLNFNHTGTVDVLNKTSSPPTTPATANIKAWRDEGKTWVQGGQHTTQFTAIVFPGNEFTATIESDAKKTPTSSVNILKLEVDGNVLYVTAAQLVKAIAKKENNDTDPEAGEYTKNLIQGVNYIINIIVKKTGIIVTATIKNWDDVVAAEETPKINVNEVYGHPTQDGHPAFQKEFDLYRSTNINGSFLGTDDHSVVSYADSKYTMSPQLYWPNHNTHYFFRGVWPLVGSKDSGENPIGPTSTQVENNAIVINNVTYKKEYYPSDLMIGRPLNTDDKTPDETCKVSGHSSAAGICATEGNVHINFRYVMSQVEVHLETATGSPTPANAVNLTNAKVEIINGYTTGKVSIGTQAITDLTNKTDFTLEHVAGEDANYRHSAIVPQILTYSTEEAQKENNLRFKITIYKDGDPSQGIDDIYYADVEPILKSDKSGKVAPDGKWESGIRYIYTLHIEKTAINVTATIKDWVPVTASDKVWF